MARFVVDMANINTIAISCEPSSPLRSPRIRSRPGFNSFPSTAISFCRSLKSKATRHPNPHYQRRSRKYIFDPYSMSTKAYQVSGFDMVKTQSSCLILDDASSQTSGATTPSVVDDTSPVLYDFGNVDASLNQQKLNILVDQRDSAHTGCFPGNKILEHPLQDDNELGLTAINSENAVEQDLPLDSSSRNSSPQYPFTPLSPPPSHRKSRREDAIVGPDDPRNRDVPLCRDHFCFPCSRCSGVNRDKPLRFPF